ncbi:GGDEF domain-containing protein [Phyllobacterium sp. SB3]|uniref:GGDEF domain-containing protein n=1 Tax=Phyllobacterium sp. SB3 TaxID=3156073 RepID=UPI0032AF0B6E
MTTYDLWMTKFGNMSPYKQVVIMVLMATVAANFLALGFFVFVDLSEIDNLLIVTTAIVVIVSAPLGSFLVGLNYRLKQTALLLELASRRDDLTGLSNRNEFYLQAQRQIALCDPERSAGAILYIDADHFKSINDQHGHAVGDSVLQEVGILLRSVIGEWDFAARFGGEEFALFLTNADIGKADWLAHKILMGMKEIPTHLRILELNVTVSVGIAVHQSGQSLEEALVAADKCLYAAKNQGRNRIVHANSEFIGTYEPKRRIV